MKISKDVNGNKILSISGADLGDNKAKGFSIQTLGNLPYTHKNDLHCEAATKQEVFNYVKEFGTDRQKSLLQTEKDFTLQNIVSGRLDYRPFWRKLTESDIDSLLDLIGKGCQHSTKKEIRIGLNNLKHLGCSWVFERLDFSRGHWSYVAGQDYTAEMPLVRKAFI